MKGKLGFFLFVIIINIFKVTKIQKINKVFSFVQGFNRLNEPQNEMFIWTLLTACISFIFGLFISLVREKI